MSFVYPVNNFYQVIANNAKSDPQKTIVFEDEHKISNQQLLAQADAVADFLIQRQIRRGDKVALVMSNSWHYLAILFAISKVGAVAVPINNFLKHDELVYVLTDSQSCLLFASAKFNTEVRDLIIKTNVASIVWVDGAPLENERNFDYAKIDSTLGSTRESVNPALDDLAVIIYTSGTTGKPKGAMLSYRNLLSIVYGAIAHYKLKKGQARMICYLPMFHAFTLAVTMLLPIVTSSGVVIVRSISTKKDFANLLKLVLLHRCRYFAGVPDIFSAMARAKLPWYFHWFHNVRGFVSGAAPLSEDVIKRFGASFKRGKLLQGYGLSNVLQACL